MAEPEELRPTRLKYTDGPRCWRTKEWGEKEIKYEGGFLTQKEASDGFHRAFNKCQLAYDSKGRKYRTNKPRILPSEVWEARQKLKKMEEKEWASS